MAGTRRENGESNPVFQRDSQPAEASMSCSVYVVNTHVWSSKRSKSRKAGSFLSNPGSCFAKVDFLMSTFVLWPHLILLHSFFHKTKLFILQLVDTPPTPTSVLHFCLVKDGSPVSISKACILGCCIHY